MSVVGGTLDLLVVGGDGSRVDEHEGGASVSNASKAASRWGAGADGVGRGGEAPESLRAVDIGVCDAAVIAGGNDGAEVVGACGVVFEAGGHEGFGETLGDGVGEEGLGGGGLDSVDVVEGKTDETIACTGCEGRGSSSGSLDSLAGDRDAANVDCVLVDSAGGARAVAI